MIGRGIFHDPFVFSKSSPWHNWVPAQRINLYEKHIRLFLETYEKDERKFETLRKFCKLYINNFEGASELRAILWEQTVRRKLWSFYLGSREILAGLGGRRRLQRRAMLAKLLKLIGSVGAV
jgi:tRNA-dihydrouridine synthase